MFGLLPAYALNISPKLITHEEIERSNAPNKMPAIASVGSVQSSGLEETARISSRLPIWWKSTKYPGTPSKSLQVVRRYQDPTL